MRYAILEVGVCVPTYKASPPGIITRNHPTHIQSTLWFQKILEMCTPNALCSYQLPRSPSLCKMEFLTNIIELLSSANSDNIALACVALPKIFTDTTPRKTYATRTNPHCSGGRCLTELCTVRPETASQCQSGHENAQDGATPPCVAMLMIHTKSGRLSLQSPNFLWV